jgi:hypothetical protein
VWAVTRARVAQVPVALREQASAEVTLTRVSAEQTDLAQTEVCQLQMTMLINEQVIRLKITK